MMWTTWNLFEEVARAKDSVYGIKASNSVAMVRERPFSWKTMLSVID